MMCEIRSGDALEFTAFNSDIMPFLYIEVAPTWFPDLKMFAKLEARQEAFRQAITLVGSQKLGDIHRFFWRHGQPSTHESVDHSLT